MGSNKYPGYNETDSQWDSHHRQNGLMTNREFFKSNNKGGFYEGMDWDGDQWVLNAENQRVEDDRQNDLDSCIWCKKDAYDCEC